jgi:hypothetical protein
LFLQHLLLRLVKSVLAAEGRDDFVKVIVLINLQLVRNVVSDIDVDRKFQRVVVAFVRVDRVQLAVGVFSVDIHCRVVVCLVIAVVIVGIDVVRCFDVVRFVVEGVRVVLCVILSFVIDERPFR